MIYHVVVTGGNFGLLSEAWDLRAKQLAVLGKDKEVWEITCDDTDDYDVMQDSEETWTSAGNEWELLETPWNSEESGARV